MEYLYSLNTKMIDDKIYYFAKKIMTFPEFEGLANVVIGYGMHTNFEIACRIADIHDSGCRKQLLSELEVCKLPYLPDRHATGLTPLKPGGVEQAGKTQKTREKRLIHIADSVNRWLAHRGKVVLN